MFRSATVPFHRLEGVRLALYTPEEIKKLSVKRITNPETFDRLLNPTYGGLYDPALGPTDKDDLCGTCAQNYIYCPGHFGHLEFPLPVYHPLFFKILLQILRSLCFNCGHLLFPKTAKELFLSQMKVLDYGLISVAEELQQVSISALNLDAANTVQDDDVYSTALNNRVKQVLKGVDKKEAKATSVAKNVTNFRHCIIKEFMKNHMVNKKRHCPFCHLPARLVRSEYDSRIFLKAMSAREANKWVKVQVARTHFAVHPTKDKDGGEPADAVGDKETEKRGLQKENTSQDQRTKAEEDLKKNTQQVYLTPLEVKKHVIKLWENNSEFFSVLFGAYPSPTAKRRLASPDMLFIEVLAVTPSRFRPMTAMGEKRFENPQTSNMNKILRDCILVREYLMELNQPLSGESEEQHKPVKKPWGKNSPVQVPGKTTAERLKNSWLKLQVDVNCFIDSDLDKISRVKSPGLRQVLEKKEGLFRKHMMGKRVNYACRSVISPDPYLCVNEIGVPEVFALKLTFPQPVTHINVKELRQAVINGPLVHPGATLVEQEDGKKTLLSPTDANQRQAIAKRLLTPPTDTRGLVNPCKQVYRHLKNGDMMLLNRQPTLHRPSMMAHKARILPGEKTIRLHYANCKSYNADFDGDEMNAHYPQSELARAEAFTLASTNFQYLVPKDGTPLSGLIQDHMVAGVMMTVRGRFFNRSDYQQLVYSALSYKNKMLKLLKPSVLKPCVLWSGKQVVSTILLNLIPHDYKPLSMVGRAKIAGKNWVTKKPKHESVTLGVPLLKGDDMSEVEVVIREGQLLCGVLDKAHYGATPFSLVHCCYELYGGEMAGELLTSLSRVFTTFLQFRGFTLGVEDILVTEKADKKRRKFMKKGRESGDEVAAEALGLPGNCDRHVLEQKLQEAHLSKDGRGMKQLDASMKKRTDHYQDLINKVCIPFGLQKRFPDNSLQLMVQSGAKGSSVNCMQISCLLGQIELEGRRPPVMLSGRSLPSFLPYDTSARAGGFVDGRFLTGIKPQEYFFHCMAGREGLVDTAVKTSRSGYLQRCLIKHLEGLQVNYDLTVRDSDSSVVQFSYGEDGLDVMKTSFLAEKQLAFMASNYKAFLNRMNPKELVQHLELGKADKIYRKINRWKKKNELSLNQRKSGFLAFAKDNRDEIEEEERRQTKNGRLEADLKLFKKWSDAPMSVRARYEKAMARCPDPVLSKLQADRHFGAVSEKFAALIAKYIDDNPDKCLTDKDRGDRRKLQNDKFKNLVHLKAFRSLVEPGEAVGLLASQSIGEPSTQMTLNTFHFAGRGDMNVTLGIPRLREILMTASANIKTPTMDLPLRPGRKMKKHAKQLQKKFTRVTLAQVLEAVDVWESLSPKVNGTRQRIHRIRFSFLSQSLYKEELCVTAPAVLRYMETIFIRRLISAVVKATRSKKEQRVVDSRTNNDSPRQSNNEDAPFAARDDDDDDDDNAELSDEEAADGDANEAKQRQRRQQHASYEAPEEDELVPEQDLEYGSEDDVVSSNMDSTYGEEEETLDEVADQMEVKKKHRRHLPNVDDARVQRVIERDIRIASYLYDTENEEWCEFSLKFPFTSAKIRVASLIEKLAHQCVVYETSNIKRCFLVENNNDALLQTEGVNLQAAWQYPEVLDLTKICTNDIHAMANVYGIEAAAKVIKKEVRNVFSAYGIHVDPRHLSLVSDYMTYEGTIKAFNRIGIESNPSPFQKMSFETTTHFLRGAVLAGDTEKLNSPSSRLVVGRVVGSGTGCFELLQPLC